MQNSKLRMIVYLAAGVFFFFFWLVWLFPTEALKSRILTEIENQTQGRYKFDVGALDISIFGSVTFKNLKVSEGVGESEKVLLKTPKLKLSFSPFALGSMAKKPDLNFSLAGSKGSLEGSYRQDGDDLQLQANFDRFPLSDLGIISAKTRMALSGILDGDIDLKLNKADPNKNAGTIDLDIQNLAINSSQIPLPSAFEGAVDEALKSQAAGADNPIKVALNRGPTGAILDLSGVKLSGTKDSGLRAEVKKDNLEISSLSLKNGDLDLGLSGRVNLVGARAGDYRLALQGGFSATENLRKALVFVFFIIEDQKNPQGQYPLNVTGRLGKPTVRIGTFNLPI
ncbi:MAG: type II secretion system protein GspN [bacterium]